MERSIQLSMENARRVLLARASELKTETFETRMTWLRDMSRLTRIFDVDEHHIATFDGPFVGTLLRMLFPDQQWNLLDGERVTTCEVRSRLYKYIDFCPSVYEHTDW